MKMAVATIVCEKGGGLTALDRMIAAISLGLRSSDSLHPRLSNSGPSALKGDASLSALMVSGCLPRIAPLGLGPAVGLGMPRIADGVRDDKWYVSGSLYPYY